MSDSQTLQKCFASLEEQLYNIKNDIATRHKPNEQYVIDEIIEGGIFGSNLEDAQDYLYHYKTKIDDLIIEIPSLTANAFLVENRIPGENPFEFTLITIQQQKQEMQEITLKELAFYSNKLDDLLKNVDDKMDSIGTDRFTNAGFKIRLDLNNEAIGSLFNTLYENNIISQKKSDGSKFTKVELADFISKNFMSNTSGHISFKNLSSNLLSRSNPAAEKTIDKVLIKMRHFLSH